MRGGRGDVVVARLGRRGGAAHAPPTHHRGLGRQAAFEDLVPADQSPALGGQVVFDLANEIALQLVFILEALGLDPGLALGTLSSSGPWGIRRRRYG